MEKNIVIIAAICTASFVGIYIWLSMGTEEVPDLIKTVSPLIVVAVTGYFAWCQLKISRAQKELSERQASTAHTKLKLDLFDKRYEAYQNIIEHFVYCYDLPMGIMAYYRLTEEENIEYHRLRTFSRSGDDKIRFIRPIRERALEKIDSISVYNVESKKKRELDLERVRFLYSDDVYHVLFDFSKECHELLGHQHRTLIVCLNREVDSFLGIPALANPNMADIESKKSKLAIEFKTNIVDTMRPYLHVPEK
ncbi:hypothetical protein HKD21_11610 [Gluconobacter cerevisiae]|nr:MULTISPECIES: hypothetical protein [Gluconobacter]MBF0877490.1 hypothetical protein [Gluconobacter cerevisiae]